MLVFTDFGHWWIKIWIDWLMHSLAHQLTYQYTGIRALWIDWSLSVSRSESMPSFVWASHMHTGTHSDIHTYTCTCTHMYIHMHMHGDTPCIHIICTSAYTHMHALAAHTHTSCPSKSKEMCLYSKVCVAPYSRAELMGIISCNLDMELLLIQWDRWGGICTLIAVAVCWTL